MMLMFFDLWLKPFFIQNSDWCVQNSCAAWAMIVSVAVRTWRVTMLFHPTAAFFCLNWDISSAARCMMGAMPLYGWQPVTEGEGGSLECDWFLCNQCYRTVIVEPWPFEHEWLWYTDRLWGLKRNVIFVYGSGRRCLGEWEGTTG